MKGTIYLLAGLLACSVGLAQADDLKQANDAIQALSERITKLSAGKSAENIRSGIATAQSTLGAAKAAVAAANGTLALQKTELTAIQLDIAEAKAAEMESAEQLVLRRAELKKLDAQFDQLLQTGGK